MPTPLSAAAPTARLLWRHAPALALAVAALSVVLPARAEPAVAVVRIDQAERLWGDAAPQPVKLPDWPLDPPPARLPERLLYRIALPPQPAGCPCGLLMRGLIANAELRFNGQVLRPPVTNAAGMLPRGLDRIVMLPLPAALWRADGNVVELDLRVQPRLAVSPLELGPLPQVAAQQRALQLTIVVAPMVVAAVVGTLGAGMLALWLRQREAVHGLFAIGALVWACTTVMPLLPWPPLGGMAYVILWTSLFGVTVAAFTAFCLRLANWQQPGLERALLGLALAGPVLMTAAHALGAFDLASALWRLLLLAGIAVALVALGRAVWRWRNWASLAVTASGTAAIAAGVHDWRNDIDYDVINPVMATSYAGLMFAATAAALLVDRYASVARESQRLNRELEARVAAQSAQLRDSVAQMRAARDEAQAADRAKSSFLAAASHDLRQPVHALGLYLAAMPAATLAPAQAELVQRMRDSLRALQRMFEALLDISRIDAGKVQPQWQTLRPWPLLRRLADEAAPQAEAQGLRLMLRHGAGVEQVQVVSDPLLLERVLRNLLANALKYTRHGGVLLACRMRAAGTAQVLRIEVWDTGPGIAESEQQRVFDEFYQLEGAAPARQDGLGLGLAIVRRLARLLGAQVQLRSVPGRGSVFSVTLPLQTQHGLMAPRHTRGAAPEAADTAETFGPASGWLHGFCIGVIEDDPDVRDAMQRLLRHWGAVVLVADSANGLLRGAADSPLPLQALVVDYRLQGGRTGPDEAAQVQARLQRQLPVLVISGEQGQQGAGGGTPWLAKPVSPEALQQALQTLLQQQEEQP